MKIAPCEICKEDFEIKWHKQQFCSLSCANSRKHEKFPPKKGLCLSCKSEFKIKYKGNKFCSRSCAIKTNNINSPKRKKEDISTKWNWVEIQKYYDEGNSVTLCIKEFSSNRRDIAEASKLGLFKIRQTIWTKERILEWENEKYKITKNGLPPSIKSYLLEKANYKCSKCNWSGTNPSTNKSTLQINHINGDGVDHRKSNLEVICPNCHSLTPNFGALNKGKGRSYRKEYRRLNPKHNC